MAINGTSFGDVAGAASFAEVVNDVHSSEVRRADLATTPSFDPSIVLDVLSSPEPSGSPLTAPQVLANPDGAIAGASLKLRDIGPSEVGSDIYALMALLQETAQRQRSAARELRSAEMQKQVTTLLDAAQDIRDSAHERMVGAIVAGSMQIIGGTVSTIAGGFYAKAAYTGEGLDSTKAYSDFSQTVDHMFRGVGDTTKAAKDFQAADLEAQKSEREAAARMHENSAQQAQDQAQLMLEIMRDIRDKLGAIEQSRQETNRGITRNL